MKRPDLDVLYEDNHLLAVNKPAGLLTQAYGEPRDNLEETARLWVKITKKKPGNVFLHTVHRLDKAASGVVLFARTGKALSRLNASMRQRQVVKIYHAVIEGCPPRRSGVLTHQLRHGSHRAEVVTAGARGAKEAVLEYRLVRTKRTCSLLEITLHTGRYHQIRAQLAVSGMPVLGDRRYGGAGGGLPRDTIALHHRRMEVKHPVRNEQVCMKAGYPPHWPRV